MGRVAAGDGAQDAAQPGVGAAAGAGPERPARDARERVPAERRARASGMSTASRSCSRAAAPSTQTDPERAAEALRQALGLWRGPPLSDLAYEAFAQTEIARLEERRWAAFEARVEAELALGRHADLVAELEAAVAEQPLREHLHGQLMLALYRCGRQAEALEAYRSARAARWSRRSASSRARSCARCRTRSSRRTRRSTRRPPGELPAGLDGGSPLLAGRDARAGRAASALLADACEGRGGVALVSGPRGIGKTRLAAGAGPGGAAAPDGRPLRGRGRRRWRRARRDATRGAGRRRPCSSSTTPTMRPRAARSRAAAGARRPAAAGPRAAPAGPSPRRASTVSRRAGSSWARSATTPSPRSRASTCRRGRAAARRCARGESGGVPLAVHRVASGMGAGAGGRRDRGERRPRRRRARRAAGGRGRAVRRPARASGARRARPALQRRGGARAAARRSARSSGSPRFDAAHAEYFFGRERLVAELVARLVGSPLLAVVGPSGSGKSSAVRAGLLPALAARRAARLRALAPGADAARRASAGRSSSARSPGARRARGARRRPVRGGRSRSAATRTSGPRSSTRSSSWRRTATGASRSWSPCAPTSTGAAPTHDRLARLVGANQVLVGPMRRDELRRAIERAGAAGRACRSSPSLTDALIADVLDEPGGLPLLSAALLEQWREREGRVLRRAAYERTGGVRGAVGRLAEDDLRAA